MQDSCLSRIKTSFYKFSGLRNTLWLIITPVDQEWNHGTGTLPVLQFDKQLHENIGHNAFLSLQKTHELLFCDPRIIIYKIY